MNRENTNEKKTLKKGRKGWVIAAALLATVGAGAIVTTYENTTPTPTVTKTGGVSTPTSGDKEGTKTDTKKSDDKDLSKIFGQLGEVYPEVPASSNKDANSSSDTSTADQSGRTVRLGAGSFSDIARSVSGAENVLSRTIPPLTVAGRGADAGVVSGEGIFSVPKSEDKGKEEVKPVTPEKPKTEDKGKEEAKPATPEKPKSEDKGKEEAKPATPEKPKSEDKGKEEAKPATPEKPKSEDKGKEEVKPVTPEKPKSEDKGKEEVKPVTPEKPKTEDKGKEEVKPATPEKPKSEDKGKDEVKPATPEKPKSEDKGKDEVKPATPEKPKSEDKGKEEAKPATPEKPKSEDKGKEEAKPATPEKPKSEDKGKEEVKPATPVVPSTPTTETPSQPAEPSSPSQPSTPAQDKPKEVVSTGKTTEKKDNETPKAEVPSNTPATPGAPVTTDGGNGSTTTKTTTENDPSKVPGSTTGGTGGTTTIDKGGSTSTVVVPGEPVTPTVPVTPVVPSEGGDNGDGSGTSTTPVTPTPAPVTPTTTKTVTTRSFEERTVLTPGVTYVEDPNLDAGVQQPESEGTPGYTSVTYTVTEEDGVEVSRVVSASETVPAVNSVVRVGTKVTKTVEVTTKDVTTKTPITHGTIYKEDSSLEIGQQKVQKQGKDGEKVEVYRVTLEDGVEVGRELVSTNETPAEDEVVLVGTKEPVKSTTETTRETFTVKAGVKTSYNDNLPKGEEHVISEGRDGSYTEVTTKKVDTKGNVLESNTEKTDVVEAEDRVVEIGTGKNVVVSRTTQEKVIPRARVEKDNLDLNEGETKVVEGKDGSYTEITTTYGDGRKEITRENEVPATDDIVYIGKKPLPKLEAIERIDKSETIAPDVVEVPTEDLYEGETKVKFEGKPGYYEKVYNDYYRGNELVRTELIRQTRINAEAKEVYVGTKKRITTKERVERGDVITRTTKEVPDYTVYEGVNYVSEEGEDGYYEKVYVDTYDKGKLVKSELKETRVGKPAKDKIVKVGKNSPWTYTTTTEREELDFDVERIADPTMEEGTERVSREGEKGYVLYNVKKGFNALTFETKDGERTEVERVNPVNKVVFYGTKEKVDADDVVVDKIDTDELIDPDALASDYGILDYNNKNYRSAKWLHDNLSSEYKAKFTQEVYPDILKTYGLRANHATMETMNKLENIVNWDLLNEKFISLVNQERARKGLGAVEYAGQDSILTKAAETRANEMADYGSLRYGGTVEGKHKRPNGESWATVYDLNSMGVNGISENAAEISSIAWNIVDITNEDYLANTFYNMWKNSPGHYATMMMDDRGYPVTVSLKLGFANHSLTNDDKDAINVVAMMEIARWNSNSDIK